MKTQVASPTASEALIAEYCDKINATRGLAVVDAGGLLAEFKAKTKEEHGCWGDLLKRLGWSRDMADRYICAHNVFKHRAENLRHLPPSVVLMLASPSTPEKVRKTVLARARRANTSPTRTSRPRSTARSHLAMTMTTPMTSRSTMSATASLAAMACAAAV